MITKRSRLLSGLLAFLMVASLFAAIPFTAGAEDPSVTVTPDMCYGTIYNEEGDPEGEGTIPYDGPNVRIDLNCVDSDGDHDWDFYIYDFDEDEEYRCFADISAKNDNVISKLVVTIDTICSDGSPVIVDGNNLTHGTRDGGKYTFDNINVSRVRLSADDYYAYIRSVQVFYHVPATYTVTWKNADGTVINTTNVTEGNVPTHAAPTKAADAEHTYTFAGWTDGTNTYGANDALPAVSGDTTYTAVFTSSVRQYTITWKLDADTVIDTTSVAYGTVPTHADAVKQADAQYTYTFTGWDTAPVAVTGDATYTATFSTTTNEYTVTWKLDANTVIDTTSVAYGTVPTHDDAVKAEDDDFTYTFAGWDTEIVAVTGDATYTAIFNAEPKIPSGLHLDADGEIRFYVDDVAIHAGLVQDDEGNYYYINSELKAVKDCTYGVAASMANGLLPEGFYTFGADGKLVSPLPVNKDGISLDEDGKIRYYVMGFAVSAGLVQDAQGNYYYISSDKTAVTNCEYFIGTKKANGLLPAGYYTFGADGKIVFPAEPEDKNGLIFDEDGEIRFYVDGVAIYAGLVQDGEGNYYYINSAKKAIKSCTYGITTAKANGLLPTGLYTFGADGKMIVD